MGRSQLAATAGARSRDRGPRRSTTYHCHKIRGSTTPLSRPGPAHSAPSKDTAAYPWRNRSGSGPAPWPRLSRPHRPLPPSHPGEPGPGLLNFEKPAGASSKHRQELTGSLALRDGGWPFAPNPCGMEVHVHERPDVSPGRSGFTARCFGCRNRYGLVNLIVLDSRLLYCRRCWQSRDILEVHNGKETVEIVG